MHSLMYIVREIHTQKQSFADISLDPDREMQSRWKYVERHFALSEQCSNGQDSDGSGGCAQKGGSMPTRWDGSSRKSARKCNKSAKKYAKKACILRKWTIVWFSKSTCMKRLPNEFRNEFFTSNQFLYGFLNGYWMHLLMHFLMNFLMYEK